MSANNGHPCEAKANEIRMGWQTVALWGELLAFGAFVLWLVWG